MTTVKPRTNHRGPANLGKFWPYKLAGHLIYSETPGVKVLPARTLVAPLSALHAICPVRIPVLKGHLRMAVELGLLESVEFHFNTVIIVVAPTPWDHSTNSNNLYTSQPPLGDADSVEEKSGVPTHPPSKYGSSKEEVRKQALQLAAQDDYYAYDEYYDQQQQSAMDRTQLLITTPGYREKIRNKE